MTELTPGKYNQFYQSYVDAAGEDSIALLYDQVNNLSAFIEQNKDRLNYKYDGDKWSIRQVVMHIIDTEHIFAYRLLRIGRGDQTALQGFEQNPYIEDNDFTHLDYQDLIDQFVSRRLDTLGLFNSFQAEYLQREGIASDFEIDAGSLIFIIAGHVEHHLQILKERYA